MTGPDKAVAKNESKPFPIHPKGQAAFRCVDVINFGPTVIRFPGSSDYVGETGVVVFASGKRDERGSLLLINQRVTYSMGKKANLRKMAEAWRGEPYTDAQAKAGIDVGKFYNVPALITVGHKESAGGRNYAIIVAISQLPEGMTVPSLDDLKYTRDEYWEKEKVRIKTETEAWLAKHGEQGAAQDGGFADDDSSLPF